MADLTITAANVKTTSNTVTENVQYGETVTQGEVVYLKSDDKYWLSKNSDTTFGTAKGIAMTGNAAEGWGVIATGGQVDLGATLAVGTIYTTSSTAGKIHPEADIATTEIVSVLGFGNTAALFDINIINTGIAHV